MSGTLARKALVIGVASSALFDLTHSDRIFREEGVAAYEAYQEGHLDDPFPPGGGVPVHFPAAAVQRIVRRPG